MSASPRGDGPTVDPDDARRAADDILSRPEYQEPQQSLVDRAVERVFDFAGDIFGGLAGSGPGSPVGWIFVIALVGAGVWLLVKALRVPLRSRRRPDTDVVYGTESGLDPTVWLDEAARLDAAGDHRGALRCRHQAMVARLVGDGVVDEVPGRTAGEYASLLTARSPSLSDSVASVTGRFEGAWYGGQPVSAEDYQQFQRDARNVEERAVETSAPATAGADA